MFPLLDLAFDLSLNLNGMIMGRLGEEKSGLKFFFLDIFSCNHLSIRIAWNVLPNPALDILFSSTFERSSLKSLP